MERCVREPFESEDEPLITTEGVLLFLVCLLDMLSSAYLFHHNLAVEANPLLRPAAEAGMLAFVGLKLATFAPGILVLERLRQHRPRFIRALLRWGLAAYTGIYTVTAAGQYLAWVAKG